MMDKIKKFLAFVKDWHRELDRPKKPEWAIPEDTIQARLENVISPIVLHVLLMWATTLVMHALLVLVRPESGPSGWWAAWFCGNGILWMMIGVLLLVVGGIHMCFDYIVFGPESDEYCDYSDYLSFWRGWIGGIFSRPLSLAAAWPIYWVKLRRYRREMQAYIAKSTKAEQVIEDLQRPDAEEIFAGIEDTKMLEALLRN